MICSKLNKITFQLLGALPPVVAGALLVVPNAMAAGPGGGNNSVGGLSGTGLNGFPKAKFTNINTSDPALDPLWAGVSLIAAIIGAACVVGALNSGRKGFATIGNRKLVEEGMHTRHFVSSGGQIIMGLLCFTGGLIGLAVTVGHSLKIT